MAEHRLIGWRDSCSPPQRNDVGGRMHDDTHPAPAAAGPEALPPTDSVAEAIMPSAFVNDSGISPNDNAVPDIHVVAVGASAGGLESLERLFAHLPADTGLAFIVLQHLSPDFR